MKAVIFGIGHNYRKYKNMLEGLYDIVLLVDNAYEDMADDILSPSRILDLEWDYIIITPNEFDDIKEQILNMGVPKEKIKILYLMKELYEKNILGYKYWGQHCDDLIISAVFSQIGIDKPSYMDLGANHPVFLSNTAFLYAQGCTGINVEVNPRLFRLFSLARPDDINLNVGIALKEGVLPFYMFDDFSGINTFSKDEAARWNLKVRNVVELPVTTLKNVVDEYCKEGFPDFLDCDIEGYDYDVLEDYDLESNGPKVICVEVRNNEIIKFDDMLSEKNILDFAELEKIIYIYAMIIVIKLGIFNKYS